MHSQDLMLNAQAQIRLVIFRFANYCSAFNSEMRGIGAPSAVGLLYGVHEICKFMGGHLGFDEVAISLCFNVGSDILALL
jgi:hypothetical protein